MSVELSNAEATIAPGVSGAPSQEHTSHLLREAIDAECDARGLTLSTLVPENLEFEVPSPLHDAAAVPRDATQLEGSLAVFRPMFERYSKQIGAARALQIVRRAGELRGERPRIDHAPQDPLAALKGGAAVLTRELEDCRVKWEQLKRAADARADALEGAEDTSSAEVAERARALREYVTRCDEALAALAERDTSLRESGRHLDIGWEAFVDHAAEWMVHSANEQSAGLDPALVTPSAIESTSVPTHSDWLDDLAREHAEHAPGEGAELDEAATDAAATDQRPPAIAPAEAVQRCEKAFPVRSAELRRIYLGTQRARELDEVTAIEACAMVGLSRSELDEQLAQAVVLLETFDRRSAIETVRCERESDAAARALLEARHRSAALATIADDLRPAGVLDRINPAADQRRAWLEHRAGAAEAARRAELAEQRLEHSGAKEFALRSGSAPNKTPHFEDAWWNRNAWRVAGALAALNEHARREHERSIAPGATISARELLEPYRPILGDNEVERVHRDAQGMERFTRTVVADQRGSAPGLLRSPLERIDATTMDAIAADRRRLFFERLVRERYAEAEHLDHVADAIVNPSLKGHFRVAAAQARERSLQYDAGLDGTIPELDEDGRISERDALTEHVRRDLAKWAAVEVAAHKARSNAEVHIGASGPSAERYSNAVADCGLGA